MNFHAYLKERKKERKKERNEWMNEWINEWMNEWRKKGVAFLSQSKVLNKSHHLKMITLGLKEADHISLMITITEHNFLDILGQKDIFWSM